MYCFAQSYVPFFQSAMCMTFFRPFQCVTCNRVTARNEQNLVSRLILVKEIVFAILLISYFCAGYSTSPQYECLASRK